MRSEFPEYASAPIEEINRLYFTVDNYKNDDEMFACPNCECFHDCKCNISADEKPKCEKKIKQKFRPQRATPKGEGHRWKAVEKTTTTWGSPADKARKRAVMDVKKQRKWCDAFMPEENDFENNTYPEWFDVRKLNFTEVEPIKPRTIRGPIRDRPCKPGFVEYTGKGWPKC
jgi:hypothetical protein